MIGAPAVRNAHKRKLVFTHTPLEKKCKITPQPKDDTEIVIEDVGMKEMSDIIHIDNMRSMFNLVLKPEQQAFVRHQLKHRVKKYLIEVYPKCVALGPAYFRDTVSLIESLLVADKAWEAHSRACMLTTYSIYTKKKLFLSFKTYIFARKERREHYLTDMDCWVDNPDAPMPIFDANNMIRTQNDDRARFTETPSCAGTYMHNVSLLPALQTLINIMYEGVAIDTKIPTVFVPGSLIHPNFMVQSCTPDAILAYDEKEFYNMYEEVMSGKTSPVEYYESNGSTGKPIYHVELKTMQSSKSMISKEVHKMFMKTTSPDYAATWLLKLFIEAGQTQSVKSRTKKVAKLRDPEEFRIYLLRSTNVFSRKILLNMPGLVTYNKAVTKKSSFGTFAQYVKCMYGMIQCDGDEDVQARYLTPSGQTDRAWLFVYDVSETSGNATRLINTIKWKHAPIIMGLSGAHFTQVIDQKSIMKEFNEKIHTLYVVMFKCISAPYGENKPALVYIAEVPIALFAVNDVENKYQKMLRDA